MLGENICFALSQLTIRDMRDHFLYGRISIFSLKLAYFIASYDVTHFDLLVKSQDKFGV